MRTQSHSPTPLRGRSPGDGPALLVRPADALPKREPRALTLWIRFAALVAFGVSIAYLMWRAAFTIDPSVWWVAIPMLVLEAHHALGLTLYSFSLWDVNPPPPPDLVTATAHTVAVLIPTYDEGAEILLPVISAAVALEPRHETWVLDDGNRPAIRDLARQLGAKYLAREANTDAKAGNLNNAIGVVDADIIGVLDADHVPLPGFLSHTLGYFDDPQLAVVQTPQDFYNDNSFEHEDRGAERRRFSEQSVFYRVILPAKNRWDAGFWCGTGALIRVEALRDVGGVATESITEDIHTSIRLHKRGWRIVVHNEVLAKGLAAEDARAYMIQRQRWARGAMQVMRSERLLTARGLTFAQRLAYVTTLFGWFDSLRTLLYILLPITVLWTGALPIDAPLALFAPAFLIAFLTQFVALRLMARGHYPPILSITFESLRLPAVIPALLEIVRPHRERRFRVTPKGARGERGDIPVPALLTALVGLSLAALAWCVLTLAGLTPLTYEIPGAIYGTALFLCLNLAFITAAMRRIRDARFAGERRASFRFPVEMQGRLAGQHVGIADLSLTGVGVIVPAGAMPPGQIVDLEMEALGITPRCVVVRVTPIGDGAHRLGLLFVGDTIPVARAIALHVFHGGTQDVTGDQASVAAIS